MTPWLAFLYNSKMKFLEHPIGQAQQNYTFCVHMNSHTLELSHCTVETCVSPASQVNTKSLKIVVWKTMIVFDVTDRAYLICRFSSIEIVITLCVTTQNDCTDWDNISQNLEIKILPFNAPFYSKGLLSKLSLILERISNTLLINGW